MDLGPRRCPSLLGCVILGLVSLSCGGDGSSAASSTTSVDSSAPSTSTIVTTTTTTPAPPSTGMGSNIESLSYLIQVLLTTEEIGGGWIDQGRTIVPPGSDQLTGFLCEEGEAAASSIGGRLDPQVSTVFRRPGDVGLSVAESAMWGGRDTVMADFAALQAAVALCDGLSYRTEELGEVTLRVEAAPELGTASFRFRFGPSTPPSDAPWLEQQVTAVLLSDPGEAVALSLAIGVLRVHDPATLEVTELEPAEYERIVAAAVQRIIDGV